MWGLPLLLSKLWPLLTGPVSQFVTGINFGQVLQTFWSIILAILSNIIKYWRYYLPAALAALQVVTAFGWYHEHNAFKVEKVTHKADIQTFKDAQAEANKLARDQEQQIIKESKVKANEADKNYSGLLTKYNASLLRYKAAQGGSKSTGQYQGDDQEGSTAQVSDGPGESSFVSITMNDAQICANNTARLMAAHQWALDIQNDKDN